MKSSPGPSRKNDYYLRVTCIVECAFQFPTLGIFHANIVFFRCRQFGRRGHARRMRPSGVLGLVHTSGEPKGNPVRINITNDHTNIYSLAITANEVLARAIP